jgi:hypothetical protein
MEKISIEQLISLEHPLLKVGIDPLVYLKEDVFMLCLFEGEEEKPNELEEMVSSLS